MEFFAQFAFTTYIFDEVFAKMTESTQSAQKLRLTDTLFIITQNSIKFYLIKNHQIHAIL